MESNGYTQHSFLFVAPLGALYKFVIFEIFVVEKKHPKLILFIVLFVPIDECLVDLFHAAWSGVVAAEVPVAGVMGTGSVESFE